MTRPGSDGARWGDPRRRASGTPDPLPPPPGPGYLDDLRDVEAPRGATPAAPALLVRGRDGVFRPKGLDQVAQLVQRGDVTHYRDTTPTSPSDVPAGALPGEYVVDLSVGTVYQVRED